MLEFFSMISDFVKSLIDGIATLIDVLTSIPDLLYGFTTVLPTPYITIFLMVIPLVIILKIIDR